jgi:uncharacterized protein
MVRLSAVSFVGRKRELGVLAGELDRVRAAGDRPGRCLLLRGRRRVGKSRLIEEFVERSAVPSLFFAASGVPTEQELARFGVEVRSSDLPGRDVYGDVTSQTWDAALRLLVTALPDDRPSIVVLDEVPYLMDSDPGFEGVLQSVWDRILSRKPVLLILVGSDLSMMEALNAYGRPFHQRGAPMVLEPLNPAEVGAMLELSPSEAFDAYLISGGLPLVCTEWPRSADAAAFLRDSLARPTSALVVSGELALAAEFPADAQARLILSAIGSGERARAAIGRAAANMPHASLDRGLRLLAEKRVVAADRPLSTRASRETRYRVADPYLRFWLYFIEPHRAELDRGRSDRVLERIIAGWSRWRGRAIEPVVREALLRRPPGAHVGDAAAVGGYWTRTNDLEVDLVGGDKAPVANEITYVGSIKWLEHTPFDHHHLAELISQRGRVPGADGDTPLVVVSRTGSLVGDAVSAALGPSDLIAAWQA